MRYRAVARDDAWGASLAGSILVHDVREANGAPGVAKGRRLDDGDVAHLARLPWEELHVLDLEPGDVHEDEAGRQLACVAAGEGIAVGPHSAGHWPLVATRRGIIHVSVGALHDVNAIEGLSVYTLFDGHVVSEGEPIARAKITPFAMPEEAMTRAAEVARATNGLVSVRAFRSARVGAVVQESLAERNPSMIARFERALGEKVQWFGSELLPPTVVAARRDVVAAALRQQIEGGASVVVVAGTRAMDELDPAFLALADLGGKRLRHGVPAHPGSLFWIALLNGVPVLGLPTCGVFSEATVFDLVLPRILCGDDVRATDLAALGHGGFLTRDMAYRFPPYRPSQRRGEVID